MKVNIEIGTTTADTRNSSRDENTRTWRVDWLSVYLLTLIHRYPV